MSNILHIDNFSKSENGKPYSFLVKRVIQFYTFLYKNHVIKIETKKEVKENFIEKWLINTSIKQANNYKKFNSYLKEILEEIKNDPSKIDEKELNSQVNKAIPFYIKQDKLLSGVEYIFNDSLKLESKKVLRNLFTIEVKSKTLILEKNKPKRTPDPLHALLASQPKHLVEAN